MIKVVVLVLTVWNVNTGEMLEKTDPIIMDWHPIFSLTFKADLMADCLAYGADQARLLTKKWKVTKGNVTTNVSCEWQTGYST